METTDLGKTSLGMDASLEATLCYVLGFLSGIVFYVLEKENKFVRFHAMQSTITFGGVLVVNIVLSFVPFFGRVFSGLISLAALVLWVALMVKAYQGEQFKLPVIGDIAEKNA